MTSKRSRKFPSSSTLVVTTWNGKSNCSRSQRVQPEGIEPPYLSQSARRTSCSVNASLIGAVPTCLLKICDNDEASGPIAKLFGRARQPMEVGRTLSTSIQPLILLGEYQRAEEAAARAREIFTREGNALRLSRLELNVGNIYHRQDRFVEALRSYELAYERLVPLRDVEGIGVALSNMAMCLITLNDFARALAGARRATPGRALRDGWHSRPTARSEMGERQHFTLQRRSGQRDRIRRIRGQREHLRPARLSGEP